MRDVVLIRTASAPALMDLVARTERLLAARRPGGRAQSVVDGERGLALLQMESADTPWAIDPYRGRRLAFTYAGFVNLRNPAPSRVRQLVDIDRRGRPGISLRASPGGIAAFFLADLDNRRGFAWSSLAGTEGLFYTEGPRAVVIASSPLVSHLVAREQDAPAFSLTWARRLILGGSTLWDDTPFEATFYARPRSTLLVDEAGVHHLPHPIALDEPRFGDRDRSAAEALARAALAAMRPARRLARPQLQLSGGKDSRLVAALAVRAGIPVDCVTFSAGDSGEGAVAARIAAFLDLPHRCVPGEVAIGERLRPTMLANIRLADGLLNENRQLAYPLDDPQPGRLLLQGQAHHPRGGFGVVMSKFPDTIRARLHGPLGGDVALVAQDSVDERRQRVDDLLDACPPGHPVDLAYWMYADWRMPRWLQPTVLATNRYRPLMWPMMDERVLMLTARLSTFDRNQELAFFRALDSLAPGIGRIPLYDDSWKFDRAGATDTPIPDGFAERNTPLASAAPGRPSVEKRAATVLPLVRQVLSELPCSAELGEFLRPEVRSALLEGDASLSAVGVDQQQLVRFLWRIAAVGLVLSGEWLAS